MSSTSPRRYISQSSHRIDLILHTIIDERVDVRVETIDFKTALFSIAVADRYSHVEGNKGVAVALSRKELTHVWEAIGQIIGITPV